MRNFGVAGAMRGLVFLLCGIVATHAAFARAPHRATPFIAIGPRITPLATTAKPMQALFSCQVGLAGFVCYDPIQMRRAYAIDALLGAGYDGTGHTIVIVDAFQSPTLAADLDTFSANYTLPLLASNYFSQVAPDGLTPFDPNDDNMQGWAGEITLDVEWAHAIAPGAKIVLVLAKSNDDADILSATRYAVDHQLGDVISMSFGGNESCVDDDLIAAQHDVFADATRKGITLLASSGDEGAAQQTCDGESWTRAVSSPASDPLVTAVGGTELHAADYCLTVLGCDPATHPLPGTYAGEVAWNEGGSIASGGGFSVVFDAPPYQKSAVSGVKQRAVPDVAYNGAVNHGVIVRLQGAWYVFGGTSAGSPQWAGIVAVTAQRAGHSLGFINSALYQVRQVTRAYPVSFNDILGGNNSVLEDDSDGNPVPVLGFSAGASWDPATGVGSPIHASLAGFMIRYWSPGDGEAAIATTKLHPDAKVVGHGHVTPH